MAPPTHRTAPLLPLLLTLALGVACCRAADDDDDSSPFDDAAGEVHTAFDGAFLPAALDAIGAAEQRVHVIQYVIYPDPPVTQLLDALRAAAARGVDVRLLADETGGDTVGALAQLQDAGVDARLDSPSTTTHNKLIVADDVALVGSHNWSTSAMQYNHEASLVVSVGEVTDYYEGYFQQLWSAPDPTPTLSPPDVDGLTPIHDAGIDAAVRDCIRGAGQRLRVVMYAIAWSDDYPDSDVNDRVEDLVDAHQRGVDVRVLLDQSAWIEENGINDRAIEVLRAGGVEVRRPPASETTHAKALACDDTVLIGDANWSYSAFSLYHGTSLAVTSADVRDEYDVWFDGLWERSSVEP